MQTEFKQITPQDYQAVNAKGCMSEESRKTYGAEDSKLEYIGSRIAENAADGSARVVDYFKDEQGRFWYQNRRRLNSGEIVSMEQYLFGRNYKRKRPR